jgi:hypothetical protein
VLPSVVFPCQCPDWLHYSGGERPSAQPGSFDVTAAAPVTAETQLQITFPEGATREQDHGLGVSPAVRTQLADSRGSEARRIIEVCCRFIGNLCGRYLQMRRTNAPGVGLIRRQAARFDAWTIPAKFIHG